MLRIPVCSYPIIVSHLSFNFLCLLLLYSIYLNDITSPYLIVDTEVQLSTPAQTNAKKCFPHYLKMEQQITKGRVQGRGKERGLLTLQLHMS
jgi:hypothetical protein